MISSEMELTNFLDGGMRWDELDREACSVARCVAVVGDRWSLMVLRDCFLGIRRFDDFQGRLGITRHVLAARLKSLVDEGVLRRVEYQQRPARFEYRLTQAGLDLYPVIMGLVSWGNKHRAGARGRPALHRHKRCGHLFDVVTICSECGEPLDPRQVAVEPGPGMPQAQRSRHMPAAS